MWGFESSRPCQPPRTGRRDEREHTPDQFHSPDRRRRHRRREERRRRGHALPARAERLPAHRPRQVDLPELRHRARVRRHAATCASTTPTRRRRRSSTSSRSRRTCAGSASTGTTASSTRRTTSRSSTSAPSSSIRKGKAYVCDLSADEIREYRGTLTEPGRTARTATAPSRRTSTCSAACARASSPTARSVLRAKIDMASPNMNLRDPLMYRIRHEPPPPHRATRGASTRCTTSRTRSSDAIEGITHSICTLEFEDHRPLYDWFLDQLGLARRPQQIEFARLNLTYTVMSKRKLLRARGRRPRRRLGRSAHADARRPAAPRLHAGGDPRVLRAHRRRQARTASSTSPCSRHCVREDLNRRAPRVMACCGRCEVVIDELPGGQGRGARRRQQLPEDPSRRARARCPSRGCSTSSATTSCEDAAAEVLPPLARARRCACATATSSRARGREGPATGEVTEICAAPTTRPRAAATPADGRKVKGTLHWVSAAARRSGRGAPLRPALHRSESRGGGCGL